MTERPQSRARFRAQAGLGLEHAGSVHVGPEGIGEAPGGDAGRLDRLLRGHAVRGDVEEDLEHGLLLQVAKSAAFPFGKQAPPGVPIGMKARPSRKTMAGAGVRRGRLPPATRLGWPGESHPCDPLGDTTQPTPGMSGESTPGSLGVAENALPSASTTQTYEVSSEPSGRRETGPDTP